MSEIKTGIRSILSNALVYDMLQNLLGGKAARKDFVANYIRPTTGMRLLDIGCGTAKILDYLPEDINYIGFDASHEYIRHAKRRYRDKGVFYQEYISNAVLNDIDKVDLVMANGILHHLQNDEVIQLCKLAYDALKPGGRFITIDPAIEEKQSGVARFLIRRDRGQNVRSAEAYRRLLNENRSWTEVKSDIRHNLLLVPYTHAIIECHKSPAAVADVN